MHRALATVALFVSPPPNTPQRFPLLPRRPSGQTGASAQQGTEQCVRAQLDKPSQFYVNDNGYHCGLSLSPGHEVPHHSYLSAHVPQMLPRCFKKYGGKTCTIQRGPWTVCGVGVGLLVCYCPRTMQQVLFLLPSVLLLCILKLSLAAFITAVGWLSSRSELLSRHP